VAEQCIFFDGGEHGDLAGVQAGGSVVATSTVTLSTTSARRHKSNGFGGGYCYSSTSALNTLYLQFTGWGTSGKHANFWIYHRTTDARYLQIVDGSTLHLCVEWLSDGSLNLRRGSTTAGTILASAAAGTAPRANNTGAYISLRNIVISDTVGSIDVYYNGTLVLTFSGGDTRNAGNASWNVLRFGDGGGDFDIDDVAIFDATATPTGEYFDVSPDPNSDVATGLTRSTGATNYGTIDERPVSATDYNAKLTGAVAGDGDTYGHAGFTGLGFTPAAIASVKVGATFRRDGVISGAKMRLKSGGTTYLSATQAGAGAGTSARKAGYWNTDPATGAVWTESGFNAAGHGAEGA